MKITAIILAAGKGRRMNSKKCKQYMDLSGKPVLYYSLSAFSNSKVNEIIVVTGADDISYCRNNIVDKYDFTKVTSIIEGGNERYESVYNALKCLQTDYVLIHDGARPLITKEIINKCIEEVIATNACIAAVPVKDTIKVVINNEIENTPKRSELWIAQTPQCFKYDLVKSAYDKAMKIMDSQITDDAMVVEKYSENKIAIVESSYQNIKITTKEDLEFSESIISNEKLNEKKSAT